MVRARDQVMEIERSVRQQADQDATDDEAEQVCSRPIPSRHARTYRSIRTLVDSQLLKAIAGRKSSHAARSSFRPTKDGSSF